MAGNIEDVEAIDAQVAVSLEVAGFKPVRNLDTGCLSAFEGGLEKMMQSQGLDPAPKHSMPRGN